MQAAGGGAALPHHPRSSQRYIQAGEPGLEATLAALRALPRPLGGAKPADKCVAYGCVCKLDRSWEECSTQYCYEHCPDPLCKEHSYYFFMVHHEAQP